MLSCYFSVIERVKEQRVETLLGAELSRTPSLCSDSRQTTQQRECGEVVEIVMNS